MAFTGHRTAKAVDLLPHSNDAIMEDRVDPQSGSEGNPEGMDAKTHHARFREIVAQRVTYRMQHHPELASRDWVIACYNSLAVFEAEFPDPIEREVMLERLENRSRSTKDGIAVVRGIARKYFGQRLGDRKAQSAHDE